jgi:hypothetical protein
MVGTLLGDWRTGRRRSQMGPGARCRRVHQAPQLRRDRALRAQPRPDPGGRRPIGGAVARRVCARYPETALGAAAMSRVRPALQRLLDTHDPSPVVVIDRSWNVVLANSAAPRLVEGLPGAPVGPLNVFRVCLHPDRLARRTLNFAEWAGFLMTALHPLGRPGPGCARRRGDPPSRRRTRRPMAGTVTPRTSHRLAAAPSQPREQCRFAPRPAVRAPHPGAVRGPSGR